jgi:hypothetical protein
MKRTGLAMPDGPDDGDDGRWRWHGNLSDAGLINHLIALGHVAAGSYAKQTVVKSIDPSEIDVVVRYWSDVVKMIDLEVINTTNYDRFFERIVLDKCLVAQTKHRRRGRRVRHCPRRDPRRPEAPRCEAARAQATPGKAPALTPYAPIPCLRYRLPRAQRPCSAPRAAEKGDDPAAFIEDIEPAPVLTGIRWIGTRTTTGTTSQPMFAGLRPRSRQLIAEAPATKPSNLRRPIFRLGPRSPIPATISGPSPLTY